MSHISIYARSYLQICGESATVAPSLGSQRIRIYVFVFSGSLDILRSIIPIYIVLSLSQFMPPMLTVIVDEKEKKIKESMRMVGLRDSVFWEVYKFRAGVWFFSWKLFED